MAVLGSLGPQGRKGKTMGGQYGQVKRMRDKADRLKEEARQAGDPRTADKFRHWADNLLASIQAIEDNWKAFGERAQGNTHRKGVHHSIEARERMSRSRKAFWKSTAGFEKMWRARRARQFREKGKCLLRFPRLGVSSSEQKWLDAYRKSYRRITGNPLGRSDIILDHEGN